MNFKMIFKIVGKVIIFEALFLLFPLIVNFIYQENNLIAFGVTILACGTFGGLLSIIRPKDKNISIKEGFVIVALVWIFMSLFGALPFFISGEIPNYINALFETVSGFTTTGGTILNDVSVLSKSIMFWRLFTHFIGGMGVLVFVLAIIPSYSSGEIFIFRAEATGPSVGKLVSKLSFTARILYSIYVFMTLLETLLLVFGGMPFYDALLYSFSTAGTGGFGTTNDGLLAYNSVYIEMVVASFMLLFGVNFNVYFLLIVRNFSKAFKSEELRVYLIIVITATIAIAINILSIGYNFWEALRYSFFQVTSISSTTGLTTANFSEWPAFSKAIILFLTIFGASAGSTGGGMKIARLIVLFKSTKKDIKKISNPRKVMTIKFEGETIEKGTVINVRSFFIIWVLLVTLSTIVLCFDINDVFTNFSATLACIGNVGPSIAREVFSDYTIYSSFSKVVFMFLMLAGRLEIFPMLFLFIPSTWKKFK